MNGLEAIETGEGEEVSVAMRMARIRMEEIETVRTLIGIDFTFHNQSIKGPIHGAPVTQNPPSGDSDTCIGFHLGINQSKDTRSGPQSTSGVALGYEGRGRDTFHSASSTHWGGTAC